MSNQPQTTPQPTTEPKPSVDYSTAEPPQPLPEIPRSPDAIVENKSVVDIDTLNVDVESVLVRKFDHLKLPQITPNDEFATLITSLRERDKRAEDALFAIDNFWWRMSNDVATVESEIDTLRLEVAFVSGTRMGVIRQMMTAKKEGEGAKPPIKDTVENMRGALSKDEAVVKWTAHLNKVKDILRLAEARLKMADNLQQVANVVFAKYGVESPNKQLDKQKDNG